MTVIFAATHVANSPTWLDAIRCAVAFSCCRVIALSDQKCDLCEWHDIKPYRKKAQWFVEMSKPWHKGPVWQLDVRCQVRWLAIKAFIEEQKIEYPVFTPDWDVLIMRDLYLSFHYFKSYDFTYGGGTYHINNDKVFDVYEAELRRRMSNPEKRDVGNWVICDMHCWPMLALRGYRFDRAIGATLFDRNIHLHQGCETDPSIVHKGRHAKRVYWKNGKPFCKDATSGLELDMPWIHCWGAYKKMTAEVCRMAGLKP